MDSIRIIELKGLRFALLSYSYTNNSGILLKENKHLLNIIEKNKIAEDIKKAKTKRPDLIIVYFHFGKEYELEPSDYQKELVSHTVNSGADIILGSHTHSIQPIEIFKTNNSKLDNGFVAYSLGNFISNQRWRYSDAGVILEFSITKNLERDSLYLSEINYLPTWVFKGKTKKGYEYIILPSEIALRNSLPDYLSEGDKGLMLQSFEDTKRSITRSTNRVKLKSPISRLDSLQN